MSVEEFKKLKDNFLLDKGKYMSLCQERNSIEKKIKKEKELREINDKTSTLLLDAGTAQRDKVIKDLENLVSEALQYIMQEDISLHITPNISRGRTECDFTIITKRGSSITETPILDSRGDGVSDIVNMALDISCYKLSNSTGVLVLDEPTKQLSDEYSYRAGEFIKKISHTLDIQILFITHNEYLKNIGDKKISFYLDKGVSKIKEEYENTNELLETKR